MNKFTSRDEEVCSYTGLFGILIAAICLIQHFFITRPAFLSAMVAIIYLFAIVGFLLLAFQKPVSAILLIIVSGLSLVAEMILLNHGLFSFIVLLLCIYSMVITIYIHVDGLPARLMQKAAAKRIEREEWKGKI
jgi:hypothetical protein